MKNESYNCSQISTRNTNTKTNTMTKTMTKTQTDLPKDSTCAIFFRSQRLKYSKYDGGYLPLATPFTLGTLIDSFYESCRKYFVAGFFYSTNNHFVSMCRRSDNMCKDSKNNVVLKIFTHQT